VVAYPSREKGNIAVSSEPNDTSEPATSPVSKPTSRGSQGDVVTAQSRHVRHHRLRLVQRVILGVLAVWLLAAYLALPAYWKFHLHSLHPGLEQAPCCATAAGGLPGDALNISIIGSEEEVTRSMLAAGWYPADPITLGTAMRIATDVVLRRPYLDAPVSSLYVWGRKEDLAFEQPAGHDPRHRHHVRFWRSQQGDESGRPIWIGADTYDVRVGLSHTTGQITHHVAPDIDAARDKLIQDLQATRMLQSLQWIENFQPKPDGFNGGGDPWHTDRRMAVITLQSVR
jgi:hypothetical protein